MPVVRWQCKIWNGDHDMRGQRERSRRIWEQVLNNAMTRSQVSDDDIL